ncbi:MAG: PH domain-containing protein [Acidobacteria bacterium]|nr:MAG: PH domain-containing protein [Acidobacteriota bacterium]
MGYVDKNLVPGEEIVYRAHIHLIIFLSAAVLALFGTVVLALGLFYHLIVVWVLGALGLAYGLGVALTRYVRYATSEFAVTNKRVLIKLGLFRRHTLELLLSRLETIGVEQGLLARAFNYGTIVVTGTGGTREPFPQISKPLEFRRQVQSAASNWLPATSNLPGSLPRG